jgi:hypothetical protein
MTSVDVNTGTRPDYEPSFRDRHMLMFSVCILFFFRTGELSPYSAGSGPRSRRPVRVAAPLARDRSRVPGRRVSSEIGNLGSGDHSHGHSSSHKRSAQRDAGRTIHTEHTRTHAHSTLNSQHARARTAHEQRTNSARTCMRTAAHAPHATHTYLPPSAQNRCFSSESGAANGSRSGPFFSPSVAVSLGGGSGAASPLK